jgi:hypothetical protein
MVKTTRDSDPIGEGQIEQGVRETGAESTTDVLVGYGTGERVFADERDDELERALKPCIEAVRLCLVPGSCLENVLACGIAEDDGKAHRKSRGG